VTTLSRKIAPHDSLWSHPAICSQLKKTTARTTISVRKNPTTTKPIASFLGQHFLLSNNDVQNSKKRLVYYYFGIKIWPPSLRRHQLAHAEENNFVVIEKLAKKSSIGFYKNQKLYTYKVEAFELVMDWFLNRFWISGIW